MSIASSVPQLNRPTAVRALADVEIPGGRCELMEFGTLLVLNDTDPNSLYLGRGDGTFAELSGASGISSTDGSMGIAWGDYDGDGKLDLTISNYIGENGRLLRLVDDQSTNDGATAIGSIWIVRGANNIIVD